MIYAIAREVPLRRKGFITKDKAYAVHQHGSDPIDNIFQITSDEGMTFLCLWKGCAHLDNGDWEREETEDA
jgi:hypothetical protein